MTWQPIETAPRDGTRVQLRVPYDDEFRVTSGAYCDGWRFDGVFVPRLLCKSARNAPTHWQPLPSTDLDAPSEVARWQMPPQAARTLLSLLRDHMDCADEPFPRVVAALAWLSERYDDRGRPRS